MRVLVACEESQVVCSEFRRLEHEAFSCDILPCSGDNPKWHIQGDVLKVIESEHWDLMVAFPPCTHLAVSGARHFEQKRKDGRQQEGIDFFMKMIKAPIKHIAVENPVGIMSTVYQKPDQCIHPYYFGDEYSKKTCLWLKNLEPLKHYPPGAQLAIGDEQPSVTHVSEGEFVTFSSGKRMAKWYNEAGGKNGGHLRSKTFPGIARAIAEQFINQIDNQQKLK